MSLKSPRGQWVNTAHLEHANFALFPGMFHWYLGLSYGCDSISVAILNNVGSLIHEFTRAVICNQM